VKDGRYLNSIMNTFNSGLKVLNSTLMTTITSLIWFPWSATTFTLLSDSSKQEHNLLEQKVPKTLLLLKKLTSGLLLTFS